jgi:hypothetical protein
MAAFMLLRSRSMALGELADLVYLQRGSAATKGRVGAAVESRELRVES